MSAASQPTIGFIGLGLMGRPMASGDEGRISARSADITNDPRTHDYERERRRKEEYRDECDGGEYSHHDGFQ